VTDLDQIRGMSVREQQLIGGLLGLQTLVLGFAFDTLPATCLVMLLAVFVVFAQHRGAATLAARLTGKGRSGFLVHALALPLIVVIWRTAAQTDDEINLLSLGVDAIGHIALFSSILLWSRHPDRGHIAMLPLGMIVLLLAVAGGAVSRSLAAQVSVGGAVCLGFAVASQIIVGWRRTGGSAVTSAQDEQGVEHQWLRRVVTLGTISILLMTTTVLANVTQVLLPGVQQAVQRQLHETLDAVGNQQKRIGGTRYVKNGQIGSVRQHMIGNPTEVALTVRCRVSPGYVRGRAFDLYRQGRWTNAAETTATESQNPILGLRTLQPKSPGRSYLAYGLSQSFMRFELDKRSRPRRESGPQVELLVRNDPAKGSVVFLPLGANWIEARSRELTINAHGIVIFGVDVTQPYVTGVPLNPGATKLTSRQRPMLTSLPAAVAAEMRELVRNICPVDSSTRDKAERISRHFQLQGSYSLQPTPIPAGQDPIAWFLRTQHPAHCEYFAAATALALRAANIPSRYVTGYVVDTRHDTEPNLWVARNQDAHAWTEAFDDQSGQWFVVESTPGRTYQNLATAHDSSQGSALLEADQENDSIGQSNWFSRLGGWLVSLRATDVLLVVFQSAQLPLFLFLVVFWWLKFHRKSSSASDPLEARSRRMLRKVERRLRKYALRREPSETLNQFAERLEAAGRQHSRHCEKLLQMADWYRQYAAARYQGRPPQPLNLRDS